MDTIKIKNAFFSKWFALVVIALAGIVIYSNTYHSPFVFDDIRSIVEKPAIRDVSNFFDLKRIPTSRPVVDLTFAINYSFGKLNVFGYHLVNILIHIINGFIVYFLSLEIMKLLFRSPEEAKTSKVRGRGLSKEATLTRDLRLPVAALFGALIFVVHPLQTQAVTYICQRYASLAALFYLASVLFYLKARINQTSGRRDQGSGEQTVFFSIQILAFYLICIICGVLAFMSKQNTASLPLAILLVEYLCVDRSWQGWKKKLVWAGMALILFLIGLLYVSGAFQGEVTARRLLEDVSELARETELVSHWSYLCTQLNVLIIYIRLLFLPIGQNLDHLYLFKSGFFDGYTPLAFLILVGVIILGIYSRIRRPVITLGIFWFFITLSVESSIIPIRDALFEHRLYLPMFGFAIVLSYLVFQLFSTRRSAVFFVSVLIIISLGTATYLRNRVWHDDLTLWKDVLSKTPENIRAKNNIGRALVRMGRFEEASSYFSEVLQFENEDAKSYYNSGVALAGQGQLDEALRYYTEALRINPRYARAHFSSGNIFQAWGNVDDALRHYSDALRIRPDYLEARINMGVLLAKKGEFEKAIVHFSEAVKIDPESARAHNNLGGALVRLGRIDEAVNHYREALRIKPEYADAHYNLGIILKLKGDQDGAIRHLSEAVRINPAHGNAHYDLGNLFSEQGHFEEAIRHLSEAVHIQPHGAVPACYNLACIYARQNMKEEAIIWLKKAVDGGFNRWDLLINDKDMENIREDPYYRDLISSHKTGVVPE